MDEIDALLKEDRSFPPPEAFRRAAVVNDAGVYARAAADPEAFWAGFARELEWITPWSRVLEWKPPYAKWFVGGKLNASVNCLDRHVRGPRRNKAAFIWEGEPGDRRTLTYWDLYRQVSAFANVLKSLGVEARRSRRALPAADPGARDRDARLRAHRRRPQRRLRRLQRRVAARSHQRRAGRRCSSPPTAATAAARSCRSSRWPTRRCATRRRSGTSSSSSARPARRFPVHMQEGRDHWYHRLMQDARARLRARGDGRRGHALHPLHLRHDGEAEGHRPHDRRLSHRHLRDDEVGVRSEGRRRLLVHRRHRLGHRPQLRRLRPARQRRDRRHVRRGARLAAEGSLLGDHRAPRRHDLLHRADRDPRVHALGHRVAGEARPRLAAPARIGRRADQPRSVDLVSPEHRPRALPDRRHLVADRDRA